METNRGQSVWNIANLLTMLRIALLPVIVWRFRLRDWNGALIIYAVSMLTDALDGFCARRLNQVTSLGKLLDPLADKLSVLVLLALFALDGQIPQWVVLLMLVKELLLVAGSAAALGFGVVVSALPLGKASTVFFVFSMMLRFMRIRFAADVLLAAAVGLSLAALVYYGVVGMEKIKAAHWDAAERA